MQVKGQSFSDNCEVVDIKKKQNKKALNHHDESHKLLCNYELWYLNWFVFDKISVSGNLVCFLSSFHLKNSSSQVYNPAHINLIQNH